MDSVLAIPPDLEARLVAWRRHLHRHPELSFQEHETTAFVAERLAELGLEVERPTPTGCVAVLRGARPGRTVAVRADIDALPIQEEAEHDYRSRREGVMHACGHDGHTAILLGVAEVLARHRDGLPGTVKLLFQPAEELPPGGALQFIRAGVLAGVDAIVGLHLMSDIPVGRAAIRPGVMMAHADRFAIRIEGRGGHAAKPHQAVDAAVVAAQVLLALHAVVSRAVDPLQPAVITVGAVEAGTAFNVIAPRALLRGTVRTLDDGVREALRQRIEAVARHTAAMWGAACEVEYEHGYPALVNDPGVTQVLRRAAERVLGPEAVYEPEPVMGGEDFAHYLRVVPGAFLFLGAGNPERGIVHPHHHPRFDLDEAALLPGVRILATAAVELLRGAGVGAGADGAC